jgi:hypothetical protein
LHIAPSGSPQPTKQTFICKLYSGFPRIFSQQKPHRRICIPQCARNAVLQENSARNLKSFFDDSFSQNKENERRRTSVLQANFDAVFGKLSPNLKSFFGDVFSQDKENKRRRTSVLQAKFDAVFGKLSPKPQLIFR